MREHQLVSRHVKFELVYISSLPKSIAYTEQVSYRSDLSQHQCRWEDFFDVSQRFYRNSTVATKLIKKLWAYMVPGDAVSIISVCMDLEPCFKIYNLVCVHPKNAWNLVKWLIVMWSFMWWCQFIDWLKFETRPSSLLNFGTAYIRCCPGIAWFVLHLSCIVHPMQANLDFSRAGIT